MKMDANGLLKKHSETQFEPCGKDDYGAYMIIEDYVIHVRSDDLPITQGQALSEIWPLVNKFQRI